MNVKQFFYAISAAVALLVSATAVAHNHSDESALSVKKQPFTEAAYENAKANGELFLVDVYADWCPTCRKQQQVLNDYFEANPDSQITVFELDFDDQKDWVTYFKAPRQSTLILYRGEEQLWFSVAQTREREIFAALDGAEK